MTPEQFEKIAATYHLKIALHPDGSLELRSPRPNPKYPSGPILDPDGNVHAVRVDSELPGQPGYSRSIPPDLVEHYAAEYAAAPNMPPRGLLHWATARHQRRDPPHPPFDPFRNPSTTIGFLVNDRSNGSDTTLAYTRGREFLGTFDTHTDRLLDSRVRPQGAILFIRNPDTGLTTPAWYHPETTVHKGTRGQDRRTAATTELRNRILADLFEELPNAGENTPPKEIAQKVAERAARSAEKQVASGLFPAQGRRGSSVSASPSVAPPPAQAADRGPGFGR